MSRLVLLLVALSGCGRIGYDPLGGDGGLDDGGQVVHSLRKPITIDPSNVAEDLDNFPVAIRIVDGDLRLISEGGKLATGFDFDVLDADGMTPLAFEIESFTPGDLFLWVKVPSLSATMPTRMYLSFGDASVTSSHTNPPAVWSNGFAGVWHLSDASQALDSLGRNHGTAGPGVGAMTGKLGVAAHFNARSAIVIPEDPSLDPTSLTISAWAMPEDVGAEERIATIVAHDEWRAAGAGSQGFYLEMYRNISNPVPTFYAANGPGYAHSFATTVLTTGVWHYFVGTYDESVGESRIFLDGTLERTTGMTGPIAYVPRPLAIGCNEAFAASPGWWNGPIDEVRLSNVVRSRGWLMTEHRNGNDVASFAVIGATEPSP